MGDYKTKLFPVYHEPLVVSSISLKPGTEASQTLASRHDSFHAEKLHVKGEETTSTWRTIVGSMMSISGCIFLAGVVRWYARGDTGNNLYVEDNASHETTIVMHS